MSKTYVNLDENVTKYFKEIKKTKLLTPEEEVDLAIRIANGDTEAINTLIKSNLKFVISIAKEYQGQGLTLSDLINEGNLGLIKAATRFDHTRGFRFISYAVWWVRQSIIQSINDNSRTIRYPSNVINKISSTKKEYEKFELEHDRQADFMDFYDKENIVNFNILPKTSSLNNVINEEGTEAYELLVDNDINVDDIMGETETIVKEELNKILNLLSDREQEIIKSYYGIDVDLEGGMTLEVIGEKYNLTKERIRQIKEKALRKLRHNAHNLFDIINN